MKHSFWKFWNDESGATDVESGLIAAGSALIAAVSGVGTDLNTVFASILTFLN